MYPDLIFAAQSAALRVWVGALDEAEMAAPSTLPGWSTAEMVAHLVAVHDGIAALRPVDPANHGRTDTHADTADPETPAGRTNPADPADHAGPTDPTSSGDALDVLTVADYLRGYPESAGATADLARTIARDTAADPWGAWDGAADQARRTLAALGAADRLVRTRRGPILASAYLTTGVIELVVHAGDLGRALPHRPPPPVLPSARAHVLTALREVLTARDPDPDVLAAASALDDQVFLDLATGRGDAATAPERLAGAVPLL